VSSDSGRSFNSNTFGLNAVGVHTANNDYFNSGFFGANFTNANNQGTSRLSRPACSARRAGRPSRRPGP